MLFSQVFIYVSQKDFYVGQRILLYYIETETESFSDNFTLHMDLFEKYDVRNHKTIQLIVLDSV